MKPIVGYPLYEYDTIIINPESYTHFLFGKAGEFSNELYELGTLKGQNDSYDLDSAFDGEDWRKEMEAAITDGATVIWCLAADELRTLVDETRLKRLYPRQDFHAARFSECHWLVVEEAVALKHEPGACAVPVLFMDLSRDLGQIEPHKGRFPGAVEEALFFLLLAPWESWSTMADVDWRGFRVPWVYTVDSDIFVRLNSPVARYAELG